MKISLKQLLGLSLALILGLSACKSTTPNVPENPKEHHEEHDHEVARAVVSLYLGHFHGKNNFHQNAWPKAMKYYTNPQVMKLERKDGKWVISNDSPVKIFTVLGGRNKAITDIDAQANAYGMDIKYYDKDGKLLNGHICEADAIMQHQHFFIAKNFESTEDGKKLNLKADDDFYRYVYMDTDPWDKTIMRDKAKRIGDENPVGLKGYFNFYHSSVKFDLNVRLYHFAGGKLVNGKPSPFNAPTKQQLSSPVEVDMTIPIVAFITSSDAIEAESWEIYKGKPNDDYTEEKQRADQKLVQKFMRTFGITEKEAFDEALQILIGERKEDIETGFVF